MNILAIESSCDETAAAIISDGAAPVILSNVVVSQIDIFKSYGGVIPEVAARSHLEAILPVIHQAFKEANFITKNPENKERVDDWSKIDAIAVTHTPGLLGSLLIGTLTARTLAILHDKPLYAVHHLKSHIYANWLKTSKNSHTLANQSPTNPSPKTPAFPLLALVISGGHTQIIHMEKHNHFEIIGTTHDDAVGECFDKIAKILGLPYPGGPAIANAAKGKVTAKSGQITSVLPGNPQKYRFPHPQVEDLDFSFSGLKTAVLRTVQKEVGVPISYPSHELATLLSAQQKADFAASFQNTAVDILLEKLEKGLEKYPDTKSIVIAGGVSANECLREKANARFGQTSGLSLFFPEPKFSGDNAAMVGAAALYEITSGVAPTDPYSLNISPRSQIS
ncbi:tRNA (adenosine(37)-N6)-threonylcarbamoyltransferase complex transferase subunit TsaD [Candidatus Saccharibacteria bacterium]|nr:tRNA (adenosine(37)-N6)-threonylcarbamoyltransferase complex transferase subunit TsaD [Candidatus Saccharibacteria bacterium]